MKKLVLFSFLLCSSLIYAQNVHSKLKPALEELKDFIAIPNDALVAKDILHNIDWLEQKFKQRGFKTQVLETEGQPLFLAESPTLKNAKTILFYMHLDGQSVDNSKWNQENPYKAVLKVKDGANWKHLDWSEIESKIDEDWRIFGRSTSDDKGPIVMFLQALDLLKENNKSIPFNVKIILDSEEEKGSKPLPNAVKNIVRY